MKNHLMKLLILLVAGLLNAVGACIFLSPVNLFDSGIAGTAMLLDCFFPSTFTLSISLLVLNLPLFALGHKRQGKTFTFYSLFSVCMYALFSYILKTIGVDSIVEKDLLLSAIFGGLLSGVGSGLVIRTGGAEDGIEVLGVLFAKKFGISIGTFVMVYNTVLYLIAGFLTAGWIVPLYSIIAYIVGIKSMDFIVDGLDQNKAVNIVTKEHEKICHTLSDTYSKGLTVMDVQGYYSKENRKMIYFIANRFQIEKIKATVREIDEDAYISVSEITDIAVK